MVNMLSRVFCRLTLYYGNFGTVFIGEPYPIFFLLCCLGYINLFFYILWSVVWDLSMEVVWGDRKGLRAAVVCACD